MEMLKLTDKEEKNDKYNSDFIKEMNDIKKEKSINIKEREDLFDDE